MKILLIANGPAALSKGMGDSIECFEGEVARFNYYITKGFEDYVGSRTDVWVTCGNFKTALKEHKKRYFTTFASTDKDGEIARELGAERIPPDYVEKTAKEMGYIHPSTGAVATKFFLDKGYEVWLWGFNFLDERAKHHYGEALQVRGDSHKHDFEWLYFHKLAEEGKVNWFGLNTRRESFPIIRWPTPCGTPEDIRWYREPAHNAWYKFFGEMSRGKTILDVGCGIGEGLDVLRREGASEVLGIEVDNRLRSLGRKDIFTELSLENFTDNSFDVVTCVDVIEHVVEDLELMRQMKRVARETVFVTTPCYARSRCGNIAHCREYTIPQFSNIFEPTRLWSASPDGKVHRTLLLEREGNRIFNYSPSGPENIRNAEAIIYYKKIPLETTFRETVDGQEWAHICAMFSNL